MCIRDRAESGAYIAKLPHNQRSGAGKDPAAPGGTGNSGRDKGGGPEQKKKWFYDYQGERNQMGAWK